MEVPFDKLRDRVGLEFPVDGLKSADLVRAEDPRTMLEAVGEPVETWFCLA